MPDDVAHDRLAALEELVESLRPVVLADHTDHGLQGMSGLVGQYRAALEEIEKLRAARADTQKGTVLDELKQRRASKSAARPRRAAGGNQRR